MRHLLVALRPHPAHARMPPKSFLLCLLLLAAGAYPLGAQGRSEVDSLALVRVVRTGVFARPVEGSLISADSTMIGLERRSRRVEIPTSAVRRVEVSLGARTPADGALRGARKGFLQGAAASAIYLAFTAAVETQTRCEDCMFSPTVLAAALSVPVTLGSTVIGAIAGGIKPGHRWLRVRLPVRVRAKESHTESTEAPR